jgi:hypothetical protein
MKLFRLIPVLFATLLLTSSCRKEEDASPPFDVTGNWRMSAFIDGAQPASGDSGYAGTYNFTGPNRVNGIGMDGVPYAATYSWGKSGKYYELTIVADDDGLTDKMFAAVQPNGDFYLGRHIDGQVYFYYVYSRMP